MSAELLRQAAEMERAEWGDPATRRVFPAASAIHLALADLLDHVADDAESNDMFDGFDPWVTVPAYGDALNLARLIVGDES